MPGDGRLSPGPICLYRVLPECLWQRAVRSLVATATNLPRKSGFCKIVLETVVQGASSRVYGEVIRVSCPYCTGQLSCNLVVFPRRLVPGPSKISSRAKNACLLIRTSQSNVMFTSTELVFNRLAKYLRIACFDSHVASQTKDVPLGVLAAIALSRQSSSISLIGATRVAV